MMRLIDLYVWPAWADALSLKPAYAGFCIFGVLDVVQLIQTALVRPCFPGIIPTT